MCIGCTRFHRVGIARVYVCIREEVVVAVWLAVEDFGKPDADVEQILPELLDFGFPPP